MLISYRSVGRHHNGDRIVSVVAQAQVEAPDSPLFRGEACPAAQPYFGYLPSRPDDLDLPPGDLPPPAGPQRLQDRFLGGEAGGKVHLRHRTRLPLGPLLCRLQAPAEPIPVPGQGRPHPWNRDQVRTDSDNHASTSPLSPQHSVLSTQSSALKRALFADEIEHLPDGTIHAHESGTGNDAVPDVQLFDFRNGRHVSHISVVEAMPGTYP